MRYNRNKVTYPIGVAGKAVDSSRKNSYDDKREVVDFRSFIQQNMGGFKDYLKDRYSLNNSTLVEYRNRLSKSLLKKYGWDSVHFTRKPYTRYLDIELVFDTGEIIRVDVERTKMKPEKLPRTSLDQSGNEIFNCFERKMKYLQSDPENFLYASFNPYDRLSIVTGDKLVDLPTVEKRFSRGMDQVREVEVQNVVRFNAN